jgi:hypothetical protein
MSGDLRQSPTSHNDGTPIEPSRPPCAKNLLLGIAEIGKLANADTTEPEAEEASDFAEKYFLAAIIQAKKASKQDCEDCLEGRGVACPALEDTPETPLKLKLVRELSTVPAKRVRKILSRGGLSGPKPPDRLLSEELARVCGFWQPEPVEPTESEELIPETSVPDPRTPRRRMEEIILTNPEQRPPCAAKLNQFYMAREARITEWEAKNITPTGPKPNRKPLDHAKDEELYNEAIKLTTQADPGLDCSNCIINCPPKHGISPKSAYDRTHRRSILPGGEELRVSDLMQLILRGLPRGAIIGPPDPQESLRKMDEKLSNMTKELAGEYTPES